MKGTYCLIINQKEKSTIKVGALGKIDIDDGFYVYIGSAMNSLTGRIKRHLSDDKKLHWHIDYLLKDKNSKIVDVIFTISSKDIECNLSQFIKNESTNEVNQFGSSDCNCNSHLYYFESLFDARNSAIKGLKNQNMDYYDLDYFLKL